MFSYNWDNEWAAKSTYLASGARSIERPESMFICHLTVAYSICIDYTNRAKQFISIFVNFYNKYINWVVRGGLKLTKNLSFTLYVNFSELIYNRNYYNFHFFLSYVQIVAGSFPLEISNMLYSFIFSRLFLVVLSSASGYLSYQPFVIDLTDQLSNQLVFLVQGFSSMRTCIRPLFHIGNTHYI